MKGCLRTRLSSGKASPTKISFRTTTKVVMIPNNNNLRKHKDKLFHYAEHMEHNLKTAK